ncbi:hypothetical protein BU15DRAFT_73830 [Melanogaster broomeanus]|nr:hypothetical protein BU15DRAFT_73830 [Melanogaster broomeanus]
MASQRESEETSPTPPEPFDNIDADVILRSSDNVDFRVFKIILSLTSPVFKDMFTLPQPDNQSPTSPSAIPVSESSTKPTFNSFREAWSVVDAAVKYDMSPVMQHLKDVIASCYLESSPLALYALCCHFGWKELAECAARQTLKIKELGRPSLYVEEMEYMTGGAHHRLLAFHLACGVAAERVGKSVEWPPPDSSYLIESSRELLLRPDPSTLRNTSSPSFNSALKNIVGTPCGRLMIDRIESLRQLYATRVEEVISEVQLEFRS